MCVSVVKNIEYTRRPCVVGCADASPTVHTIAAYATGAGSSARESKDPSVRNGFFTGAVLQHLRASGASVGIRKLLNRKVKATAIHMLAAATGIGGQQVPEVRDGLPEDVVIAPSRFAGAGAGVFP
jgi:hypothetical protein